MSKILRTVLVAGYSVLIIHFLRVLNQNREEIQIAYMQRPPGSLKKIVREIKNFKDVKTMMDMSYKKPIRLPTDLKYVLKWTEAMSHYDSRVFVSGQKSFLYNNCTYYNCHITNDKSLLADPRAFDAILFDVENNWDPHPVLRAPNQIYIFTAAEPASSYPMCHPGYNYFYNWTWTYKLNSNIVQTFFNVYHNNGTVAGPRVDMKWITSTKGITGSVKEKLRNKKKMVAWFVSQCTTKSGREKIAEKLSKALELYGWTVDIYGWCGKLVCPRETLDDCLEMLQTDYYFYLAFENSLCEDYVTEKVVYALKYYTVPVVYGGANYSRFLPPGSYVDAKTMDPAALASLMIMIIKTPDMYESYFRWHHHYYIQENPMGSNVCRLCEILNDPEQQHSQLDNFTDWWNTGNDTCSHSLKLQSVNTSLPLNVRRRW